MENLSNKLPLRNSEFNEGDFQPGVSHSSIEVATFTLFFSVYCQVVVGREFEMKRNRYNENLPKGVCNSNQAGFRWTEFEKHTVYC